MAKSPTEPTPAAVALYDCDDTNPSFARIYPSATQLLPTPKGLEPLFEFLESPQKIAVVDFGARSSQALVGMDGRAGFLETAAAHNTRVIVCFALSPEADSIALLKTLADQLGKNVEWIIVRGMFLHGTWSLWEGSRTRLVLGELGAAEIAAPILDAEAWAALGTHLLTASAAATDKRLKLQLRSHLVRWRKTYAAEFETAVAPILDPDGKTILISTGDKGGVGKSSFARALTDWLLTRSAT